MSGWVRRWVRPQQQVGRAMAAVGCRAAVVVGGKATVACVAAVMVGSRAVAVSCEAAAFGCRAAAVVGGVWGLQQGIFFFLFWNGRVGPVSAVMLTILIADLSGDGACCGSSTFV